VPAPSSSITTITSGNLDSTSSSANGLANEADTVISTGSQIYQPFAVKGKLVIAELCVNSLDESAGVDNPIPYEIRSGAAAGTGGTLVCHGTATSSDAATGRGDFGLSEYTHAVKVKKCILTKKGQDHMNVQPQCFKGSNCSSERYFMSTDDSNLDHIGPPTNRGAALWNSTYFGENWVNPNTVFGGTEMESFSAGIKSGKR